MTMVVVIVLSMMLITSCKTTKQIDQKSSLTKFELPFSDSKYQTDKKTFRSVQSGSSDNLSNAREIAKSNARSDLSYNIETVVKSSTDIYANQLNKENGINFERMSRQVSKQILTNIKSSEEIYKDNKTSEWTCWILMEINKEDIITNIDNTASQEKIKFDKYQYEKILDKEMDNYIGRKAPINE